MAAGDPNGLPPNPGSTTTTTSKLIFYPSYCFAASPTYFNWVKLTAYDVHHTLSARRGFEGPNLYFYLNHPVQFVYLVGVVVSYDDFHEKRWVLTIDDSSGATIEVTCPKPEKPGVVVVGVDVLGRPEEADGARFVERQLRSDAMALIDVGSVIQARGTVGHFRGVRQIHLERIDTVPDTNAEMHFWNRRTQYKTNVLSVPWDVSSDEQIRLLKAAESREEADRARACKLEVREAAMGAREKRHARRIAKRYEQEELKRKKAAERARQAGEVLMVSLSRKGGTSGSQKKSSLSKEVLPSKRVSRHSKQRSNFSNAISRS